MESQNVIHIDAATARDFERNWAEVELYRWQHGNLPGDGGSKVKAWSPEDGMRGMAAAIEKGDMENFPTPFNVVSVLRYAANLIESKKKSFSSSDRAKVGRNDPCVCGSGRKFKQCCGRVS